MEEEYPVYFGQECRHLFSTSHIQITYATTKPAISL